MVLIKFKCQIEKSHRYCLFFHHNQSKTKYVTVKNPVSDLLSSKHHEYMVYCTKNDLHLSQLDNNSIFIFLMHTCVIFQFCSTQKMGTYFV